MKKRVLIIVLGITILFGLSRMYNFVTMNRILKAIAEFKSAENREYLVRTTIDNGIILETKIMLNQEIEKYIVSRNQIELNYRWRNFYNDENYSLNRENKLIYKNVITIQNKDTLVNLPDLLEYFSSLDKIDLFKILKIRYIVPTEYENKKCYKIVTRNEIIIIDKNTNLPVFSKVRRSDSEDEMNMERTYEFKVGGVTDEDVALPDLSEYTFVE